MSAFVFLAVRRNTKNYFLCTKALSSCINSPSNLGSFAKFRMGSFLSRFRVSFPFFDEYETCNYQPYVFRYSYVLCRHSSSAEIMEEFLFLIILLAFFFF